MSTLSASFVTVVVPLTASSSLFVDNHATTSAPSPSSLILRRQLRRLPCHPPSLPRRRGCRCRLSSLWFFPSSARHRCLSSLWFFPSSARHHRHPQDLALPLQISSLFLSSIVQLPLLALLQRCLFSLPQSPELVSVTVFSDPRGSVVGATAPAFSLSLSLAMVTASGASSFLSQ